MKMCWKNLSLFFKLFLLQSLFCFITKWIIDSITFKVAILPRTIADIKGLVIGFFLYVGIGGFLFLTTSLTYIIVKNKMQTIIFNLIWMLLYLFVFFERVLDIGASYKELLLPFTIGVCSILFFKLNKIEYNE